MSVKTFVSVTTIATVSCIAASSAVASVAIFGGPTYDSTTGTGYQNPRVRGASVSTTGNNAAVLNATKYVPGPRGFRALRWDATGADATELGNLGTDSYGTTFVIAAAINAGGTVIGYASKYSGGEDRGTRAVRWNPTSTAAIELGHIGVESSRGFTSCYAIAINAAGTATGWADKYGGLWDGRIGERAVRWDASGTAATELGHIGTNESGVTKSRALAINADGTAAGYAQKYNVNLDLGFRAVRWNASGIAATELGNLGTSGIGFTSSEALAINNSGTVVGYATKYLGGTHYGNRAVRWDAMQTVATELEHLGTFRGGTDGRALAINSAGTAVGYVGKYSTTSSLGLAAVRWNASGIAVTELGNLGTSSNNATNSSATAINDAGIAIGYAEKYVSGIPVGTRAVAWGLDGVAIDLNTLLAPADAALWMLTSAGGISETNWISGIGRFDPDGTAGALPAYDRAYLLQLPSFFCDSIDFNNDSIFPTDEDIVDFFSVLAGGACSPGNTCNDIDFNNDGLFPDDNDLVSFLTVLAGGNC